MIKSIIFCVISAIFSALAFWDGRLWIFAWFGFVPLFICLKGKEPLGAFFLSYLWGMVFWGITIYWLIHVTLAGQILLILYLPLYSAAFGLVIHRLLNINYGLLTIFFIPSLWVLLEYLRAHLLSGFGWALLGYSQYLNLPVIQIADIFGSYGVSFLVMMVNAAVYRLAAVRAQGRENTRKEIKHAITVSLCMFIVLGYGYFRLYEPLAANRESPAKFNISVIQGNIPQELKWVSGAGDFILQRYLGLSRDASRDNPDLIIWPEASVPGFLGEDELAFSRIMENARDSKTAMLIGAVASQGQRYFNSALLIDKDGKISKRYDKLHLVPFGEYIPFRGTFKFLENIAPIGDFTSGGEHTVFSLAPANNKAALRFSVLICFEDTIAELSRGFVRNGADFLVNITNDGWFGQTSAPYQHLAASVFRAVENRVMLARSANTGISCFINDSGKVIAKVRAEGRETFVSGVASDYIYPKRRAGIYQKTGDMFVLVCLVLVCFYGIIVNSKIQKFIRSS